MALTFLSLSKAYTKFFTVKKITWILIIMAVLTAVSSILSYKRIRQIEAFNIAVSTGKNPVSDQQSFEAKFATALWLAKKERFKEATLLFTAALPLGNDDQKSAAQYNIGNMFFLKGLKLNGQDMTVRNETEYLMQQAATAYKQSVKLNNHHWDAKHNLDRVLLILPGTPTPGVGDSDDSPGLIMGNIPVGLP